MAALRLVELESAEVQVELDIDLRAAEAWPDWAVVQIVRASSIATDLAGSGTHALLATELFRRWYAPVIADAVPATRPLAGVYRAAHAGSRVRRDAGDGTSVLDRQDVVRRDGWWRTWGDAWVPTRSREQSVRVLLSPRGDRLSEFVNLVTTTMRDTDVPWLLACATDPRRIRRMSSAVLYLPSADDVPRSLVDELGDVLHPGVPPLCRRLARGIGVAHDPRNGMSFGEHRSHLIALALRSPADRRTPLAAVAHVFASHGLDTSHPYRT